MKTLIRGIVLLGHGSRREEANRGVEELAAQVERHFPRAVVEVGYLAHGWPPLAEAVATALRRGAQEVVVVPLFLYDGVHVRTDIPEQLEELRRQYPGLRLRCTATLGSDPRIAEIVLDRIREGDGG
ncbi:MAG: sirohydrochlorin chelatase [Moorellales bacterium]